MESVKRRGESQSEISKPAVARTDEHDRTTQGEAAGSIGVVIQRSWIAPRLESLGKVEEMTMVTVGGSLIPP